MPHFFINSQNVNKNIAQIDDKENYVHIAKSLRSRTGERLLLIDENGIQYETIIEKITSSQILARVEKQYKSARILDFNLYLAQSPLRSDAQNFVIEKATELGAAGVYPVFTDNCALAKSVIEKKIPKWNRIMSEASKQCERANIPVTYDLTTIETLINSIKFDKVIAFCERKADLTLRDFCEKTPIKQNENVLLIIGPEGGFSEREFQYFEDNKIPMLTLGNLILKAETAVVAALSNVIYEYNNCRKN